MKSSEKALRTAFVEVYNMVSDILDTPDVDPELKLRRIRERIAIGIADSNDTDLDRLVEWLEKGGTPKGTVYNQHILNYIAEKFGAGGDDGS